MANLLDQASIILTPTAYDNGKVLCVKPSAAPYGDFDFSRNSSATRVNAQGLVENVQTISGNLLDYSTFTSPSASWSLVGGLWVFDDTANGYLTTPNIAVVVGDVFDVVVDVTIASGNANFRYTSGNAQTSLFDYTDFVDGVNEFQATVTGVDGILQRIFAPASLTDNPFTLNSISIKKITDDTNLPRINYDGFSYDGSGAIIPNSGCGSWLFEPQSTNLITQSELFSDASWTKIATTVSSNSTTSPSGGINASTIVSTNATSEQYLDVGGLSVTSGDSYTLCCFVKKKDYDYFLIRFTGVGGAFVASNAFFDINNGTLGTVDSGLVGSITDYGNGWYRCSATIVASATTVSGKVRLQLASSDNSEAIVGDGTSGTFVWGAQFEQQSYATSYIPTEGTTVTRNQDVCTNGGSAALINSTEGTLYAEISALTDDGTQRSIAITDGTVNNIIVIRYNNYSGNSAIDGIYVNNGVLTPAAILYSNSTDFTKIALSYQQGALKLYVNGTLEINVALVVNDAINWNTLQFNIGNGTQEFYGKTKALAVYKTALTDAQLTLLTTI
jgi:hypothetical protein